VATRRRPKVVSKSPGSPFSTSLGPQISPLAPLSPPSAYAIFAEFHARLFSLSSSRRGPPPPHQPFRWPKPFLTASRTSPVLGLSALFLPSSLRTSKRCSSPSRPPGLGEILQFSQLLASLRPVGRLLRPFFPGHSLKVSPILLLRAFFTIVCCSKSHVPGLLRHVYLIGTNPLPFCASLPDCS